MFRSILVAYDGSEGSRRALGAGIELAKHLGAELHSISVMEHLPHYAAIVGEVKEGRPTQIGKPRPHGIKGSRALTPPGGFARVRAHVVTARGAPRAALRPHPMAAHG